MTKVCGPTVGDLGELGLLQRLFRYCPSDVVGDDAAVIALPPGQRIVVTTDMFVDGVHFSDRTTTPEDVGWRAVAANLSDLAAMGATPLGLTVALSLPKDCPVAWVEQLYQGMAACLERWGGQVIGGDLCRSERISLSITALGQVAPDQVFYRHAAQPGQVIVATGYHGLSRAGLDLLLAPDSGADLDESHRQRWIQAHQRPTPRLDVVAHLRALQTDPSQPIAAMDSSDGLANAVLHLCQASGVGAILEADQLPLDPALVDWVGLDTARHWCLYGGEDFELVICLPEPLAQALRHRLGPEVVFLGYTTTAPDIRLHNRPLADSLEAQPTAAQPMVDLSFSQGFQHF